MTIRTMGKLKISFFSLFLNRLELLRRYIISSLVLTLDVLLLFLGSIKKLKIESFKQNQVVIVLYCFF